MKKKNSIVKGWQERTLLLFLVVALVTGIFIASTVCEGKVVTDDIRSQSAEGKTEPATNEDFNPSGKMDNFELAIIGVSFGCMAIGAALFWQFATARAINSQLSKLNSFITKNNSAEVSYDAAVDEEPMQAVFAGINEDFSTLAEEIEIGMECDIQSLARVETRAAGILS